MGTEFDFGQLLIASLFCLGALPKFLRMCLICIFIFCFHFLKTIFIFKRFEFWKHVWLLVFWFQEIKILKIHDILTSYLFCIFRFVTAFLFYSKWSSCFQLETLKTRFYCFIFWLFPVFIFAENIFKNPTKRIFIIILCFQWK